MVQNNSNFNWVSQVGGVTVEIGKEKFRNNIYYLEQLDTLIKDIVENNVHVGETKIADSPSSSFTTPNISQNGYCLTWFNFYGDQTIEISTPDVGCIRYSAYFDRANIPFLATLNKFVSKQKNSNADTASNDTVKKIFDKFCNNKNNLISEDSIKKQGVSPAQALANLIKNSTQPAK